MNTSTDNSRNCEANKSFCVFGVRPGSRATVTSGPNEFLFPQSVYIFKIA